MSTFHSLPSIDMRFGAFERAILKTYFLTYLRTSLVGGKVRLKQSAVQWYEQNRASLKLLLPSLSKSVSDPVDFGDPVLSLRAAEIDAQYPRLPAPSAFQMRIEWLAEVLRLDETESRALGAVCRLTQMPAFMSFAAALTDGYGTSDEVQASLVGRILGLRRSAIHRLFSRDGQLTRLGLIEDRSGGDVSPSELVLGLLRERTGNPDRLKNLLLGTSPEPKLSVADFDHMASHVGDVTAILRGSLEQKATGVNLLFYGAPGSGKTELAKLLGPACDARVIFAGEITQDRDEPDRNDRIAHLSLLSALGQRVGRVIAVVDEAEDVLGGVGLLSDGRRGSSKVFLNRLTENSVIPTIWITNRPEGIDEAILRRMVRVVEFRKPGHHVTTRIVKQHAAALGLQMDDDSAAQLGRVPLAPAIIASSIRAASLGRGGAEMAISVARSFQKLIRGFDAIPDRCETLFDPVLTAANIDLTQLASKIVRAGTTRLSFLFTGLPGTGKTAFARYLADLLRLDVLEKRGSDLLGKYVGETEGRIAAAFAEAKDRNCFLIFDEADSLLCDRRGTDHRWEISLVNEMLTWMERHPLPFAATSNLEARLDPAVYRRFLFKARFEPLQPHQIGLAFQRFFSCDAPAFLLAHERLTLGDFALIKRQAEVLGICDPNELARMLEREAGFRPTPSRRIGFQIH